MDVTQDVLNFWIDEVGPEGWYATDPELDARIAARFGDLHARVARGQGPAWGAGPQGALAALIVLDQFSRNLHRDDGRAFDLDARALAHAKSAIDRGQDRAIPEPQRQFFYLPLMHSESLPDQERAVRMFVLRMPETGASNLLHARAHRAVIRRFGRFPHRNADLGRPTTTAEAAFLADGGYGGLMRQMQTERA